MIKYEFRCRASQQEQAAFWKARLMFELGFDRALVIPHGGDVPPSPLAVRCSHFTNPESSFPPLTEEFVSENDYFVCDNVN